MNPGAPEYRLVDLQQERRPDLLAEFVRLYDRTFTDPTERDDPSAWADRLWGAPRAGQPLTHLLAAVSDSPASEVRGGAQFEYYPRSRCGLIAYLVVDARCRRQGLAARLVQGAISALKQDAAEAGGLRAVLAETEDPTLAHPGGSMPPRERLAAFARLGAGWVDLPYVQPALPGAPDRARHLLLLAFGLDGAPPRAEAGVLLEFLDELYRALGVPDPAADPDWIRMADNLRSGARLRSLAER